MVNYICDKCDKKYTDKAQYSRHINRKYSCGKLKTPNFSSTQTHTTYTQLHTNPHNQKNAEDDEINNNQKYESDEDNINENCIFCKYCNKNFSRNDSLKRHIKSYCNVKKDIDEKDNVIKFLMEKMEEQKSQLEENKKEIMELHKENKKTMKKLTSKINSLKNKNISNGNINNGEITNGDVNKGEINNNTNNGTINNNYINIHSFGNENLDFLTNQDYKDMIKKRRLCLVKYINLVHFNKEQPQNHNIYIPNVKNPVVEVMNKSKEWELRDIHGVIEDIKDKGYTVISEKYYENLEKLNHCDEHFERFIEEYDDDSPELKKFIEKEIKLSMINGRKIVEKTKTINDTENKINEKKPKTIKSVGNK